MSKPSFNVKKMSLPLFVHIFAAISIVMVIIVIYQILRFREQSKSTVTFLLILAMSSVIIWILFTYLQMDLVTPEKSPVQNAILSAVSNIFAVLGLIALTSFVHYFISPQLDFTETSIMFGFLFTITGLKISHVIAAVAGNFDVISVVQLVADILSLCLVIFAVYLFNRDFRLLLQEDLSPNQRRQVKFVYYGLLIGVVGTIPSQLAATFVNFEFLSFAYITFVIGLILMINGYLTDPRVIFILPERTYLAIVVNDHGTFRYSRDFTQSSAGDANAVLISGALKAITSLMSDFYETRVSPELIKFRDQMILFKWVETFFLAIFCDRDSPLIRNAMEQTIEEISDRHDNLEKAMYGPEVPNYDDIFDRTFYFIYK